MYVLKPGIKEDPVRRWNLPDRVFFGHGACHILAGVFIRNYPDRAFWAEWVKPLDDQAENHIYLTDGRLTFDYHGYSSKESLLRHHERGWSSRIQGWGASVTQVDFDLLDTSSLNIRKMRGPDQYLEDPIPRAIAFLERHASDEKHQRAFSRSRAIGTKSTGL